MPCSRWPAEDPDRFPGPWSAETGNPLLLINPRFDPASPYMNAITMNGLFPDSRLLTVDGWGHTALMTLSACSNSVIERYLIDGTLPEPGTVCAAGSVPFGG
jgi:hypothetical protein